MDQSLTKTRIEICLLFMLYIIVLPRVYMTYDMGYWREWALYIHQHGLSNVYNAGSPINYFPLYVYGMYVYDLLQGTEANIINNINSIKLLFVFFDFLPVFVLCCFRQRLLTYQVPYLFLLLNVAYVFNSMVWGQIDSIYTNLAFLAIVAGLIYPAVGAMLYALALLTKPQAIVFAPVMGAVLLYSVRNVKTLLTAMLAAAALTLLLLLPFMHHGGIGRLAGFAKGSVGLYHNLSISAFNIWYLITSGNPYFINDTNVYALCSYRNWGLVLFGISALCVLIPLYKMVWQIRRSNLLFDNTAYRVLFLGTGLLCLFFFYFNTQMHERYAHPIIIFFFFYGVVSKNYKLFALASIPYFLSLDKAFSFPDGYLPIVHYKFIYASKVIALWYTAVVVYGGYLWYQTVRANGPYPRCEGALPLRSIKKN
jgi:Gpi18-like mannosyltransferase